MKHNLSALMASVCAVALVGAAHADTFVNGSFETGDLTGWTVGGGSWSGGPYPVAADYLPGGVNYNPSQAAITITNSGLDPFTDNNVNMVYAGAHSVQVNDSHNNNSVSVISQRVNNYTDPLIAFAYAAVLQSSHGPTDSDAFIITLTDATTNSVLFSYNLNSATAPGVFTQSNSGWFYTNWIAQSVDVSALEGHDFILSLLANDCPYGGHAGYAYLDGFGSQQGGGGTGGGTGAFSYWDGDGASSPNNSVVDGGDGVWTTTSTNFTDSGGVANGVQIVPSTVVFSGQPGTVTVDDTNGQVTVEGMNFTVDGYTITGGAIGLSGSNATVSVGDGTPAGAEFTATIDSVLTGAAGLTKTGLGTLVLNGVNTYAGGTTITAGTLVGSATSFGAGTITDNAALVINQPTDAAFANDLEGGSAATFTKTGAGTLDMTGTGGFSGSTIVAAGRLQVDGALDSSIVTVQSGGVLGGSGSVGGVEALSGSTIAPGAGATEATLTVTDSYHQASGSVYHVNADAEGGSDKIVVGSGATLDAGAQLHLTRLGAAHFIVGTRYTVLSSDGLEGTFTLSGDTHVSTFVDVVDQYDSSNAYLLVKQTHSFASVGNTPNQIAAAGGADVPTGPLYNSIVYLQTADQARAAFDAISGEIHAQVRGAGLEDSRFIREAIFDDLRGGQDASAYHKALWGRGFGSWGHADSDGNAASYSRDIGGFFMGADVIGGKSWHGGVVGGYSHSSLNSADRGSKAQTDDYHLGAYVGTQQGAIGLRAGGAYTWRRVTTDRMVAFTGFSDVTTAAYNADVGQVFGEIGYRLGHGAKTFEPFFNVAYVDLRTAPLAEHGGASVVTGKSGGVDAIFTTVGARAASEFTLGQNLPVKAHVLAGWRHADGTMTPKATLAFAGGPDFTVAGLPIAQDALSMEAGLDASIGKNADFDISYSGQVASRVSDHGVKATLSWRF